MLNKLEWYKVGGGVSERQLQDVIGVLRVKGDALNRTYMSQWAKFLDVEDLLERALNEA